MSSDAKISLSVDGYQVARDAFLGIQKVVEQAGNAAAGTKPKFDMMAKGMSAAAQQSSDFGRIAAGMGTVATQSFMGIQMAVQKTGDAAAGVKPKFDLMVRGMADAARASAGSIQMIGGMSEAGRKAADAMKPVERGASIASSAMGVLTSAFGQFTAAGLATAAIQKLGSEMLRFADLGTRLPAIESAFNRLNTGIKQNAGEMLAAMQGATTGLVADFDLMQTANKAMLLGLPVTSASMGELAKTATVLGKAMGQDATASLDDLITALGRSSPMILDNLGLTVKVGEANEAYAAKLGKSADSLTDAEKKMAFYNAAMEAARKKTAELGDQTKTLGEVAQTAWVTFSNAMTKGASAFNIFMGQAIQDSMMLDKELIAFTKSLDAARAAAEKTRPSLSAGVLAPPELPKDLAAINTMFDAQAKRILASADAAIKHAEALAAVNQKIADATRDIGNLTPVQQRLVEQYKALGLTNEDVAIKLGVSALAVKAFEDEAERAKDALDAFIAGMQSAREAAERLEPKLGGIGFKMVREDVTNLKEPIRGFYNGLGTVDATLSKLVRGSLTELPKGLAGGRDRINEVMQASKESSSALDDLTRHFVEMGQIAGGSLDDITRAAGLFVASVNQMSKSSGGLKGELKELGNEWKKLSTEAQVATVAMAALDVAAANTDAKSRGGQSLSYAKKGAQIGMVAGPYGALVGMGVGAIVGAMKVPPNELEARAKFAEWQNTIIAQFAKMASGAQRMEAGSEGWKKVNVAVRDEYRRIGLSGEQAMQDISIALDATHRSAAEVDAATARINENLEKAARVAELARGFGLTDLDLVDTNQRLSEINDQASELYENFQSLIVAGYQESAVLQGMSADVNQFIINAIKAGQGIPPGMQPIIEKLIETGQLTEEAARAMMGLGTEAAPSFSEVSAAAERLGLTIEDLGTVGRQLRLNDAASSAAEGFQTLQKAGVDTTGIFTAMSAEAKAGFQNMATEALKSGLTIPEAMKPIFQGLLETGGLTDEFGNALSDLSRFNFAKPLEKMVDDLIKKLDELIDKFGAVGNAAGNMPSPTPSGTAAAANGAAATQSYTAAAQAATRAAAAQTVGVGRGGDIAALVNAVHVLAERPVVVKMNERVLIRTTARGLPSELRREGAL